MKFKEIIFSSILFLTVSLNIEKSAREIDITEKRIIFQLKFIHEMEFLQIPRRFVAILIRKMP